MNSCTYILKRGFRALCAAAFIAALLTAVFSVVLSKAPTYEKFFAVSSSAVPYIAVFVFAAVFSRGAKKNGWLTGAGAGVLCAFLLVAAGCAFFKNAPSAKMLLRVFLISSAAGAFGGIVGINTAQRK